MTANEPSNTAKSSGDENSSDIEIVEIESNDNEPRAQPGGLASTKCPICLEIPDMFAVAECGHAFCHECVQSTLSSGRFSNQKQGQCPLCRKTGKYASILYLELKVGQRMTLDDAKQEEDSKDVATNAEAEGADSQSKPEDPENAENNEDSKTTAKKNTAKRAPRSTKANASKRKKTQS